MSLRSHLLALVLVTLVPVLIFCGVLVFALTQHERATVEQGSRETARALAVAVDQQLEGVMAALSSLALSREITTGDLQGFHEEAGALRAEHDGWESVYLYDRDGEGLVHASLPYGTAFPSARDHEAFGRLLATGRPVVSDLTLGRAVGRPIVAVLVPVKVDDQVKYVLGASLDSQRMMRAILERQRMPADGTITISDRNKVVVARTVAADRFVGKPVSPRLAQLITAAPEGSYEDVTLDGVPVYAAYSRSPLSGWTVAISIPSRLVDASLRRSLLAVVGAGFTFIVLAVGLAALVGRRIAAAIESLSPAAHALARGAPLPTRDLSMVTEVDGVAGDLTEAAAVLAERAADRSRTEEERARLLARAEAARGEAEVANRTKDEFLATVSHELRTPLTAILGWARMLRGGRLAGDAVGRGLEVIDRNARLQAQLIDDLLDVSRIITGKLRLEVRPIELAPVIDSAIDAVRDTADAKGVILERNVGANLTPLRGDPNRLQQVVWNLLANAIKFTPSGGRVNVVARVVGSELEIAVSDNGKGIEREFLPFVFDRFRQSAMGRASGGLGLGLALVRHLTELHGGTVQVHSDGPDHGATFTVRLPSGVSNETVAPVASTRPTANFPSLSGVRVLVVDDDDDARQLLALVLEQCHAEVLTAASTEEALRRVENEKPDIVLSDINMPDADGYAFVRALRERDGGATHVPTIALTASVRGEDRRRALAAGFDMHVAKPVEPAALAEIVAELAAELRRVRARGVATGRV
jgi:signal transduction histidine kinase/ActR/RegA family two-component response regulator